MDKLTRPMVKALRHAADNGEQLGKVDGMVRKGLLARGAIDAAGRMTEDGWIALHAEEARLNFRGLRGVRVGDMIQWRNDSAPGRWGVVLLINGYGEAKTRFGGNLDLWIPGVEVQAVERRP